MEKYPQMSPYLYCSGNPIYMIDSKGKEGVRYIDDNNNRIIETNVVIITRAPRIINPDWSESKKARVERRNNLIENNNKWRIEQIQSGLEEVFSNTVDSEGHTITFKFNYITISENSIPQSRSIAKYQQASIQNGILAETPNKSPFMQDYGKAIAVVFTLEPSATKGDASGPFIRLSDMSATTVGHEVGHTFGLMAYPPERLTPSQVSLIWEKAYDPPQ